MFYVYIIQNSGSHVLYIGFSENVEQRVSDHNSGKGGFTRTKNGTWKLIYYEMYLNKMDALGREKFLKGGSGRKYIRKQLKKYFEENQKPE